MCIYKDTRDGGNLLLLCKPGVCRGEWGCTGFLVSFSQCFLHIDGFIAGKLEQQLKNEGKDRKKCLIGFGNASCVLKCKSYFLCSPL